MPYLPLTGWFLTGWLLLGWPLLGASANGCSPAWPQVWHAAGFPVWPWISALPDVVGAAGASGASAGLVVRFV
ncbi:MAG TPA: hypothetical protein DDY14_14645, partial [Chromatiaceae bacterium]|nr:hypothetical protein [Chromatiaceae bacterium]